MKEQSLFEQTIPDTNRYFLPVFINPSEGGKLWLNINSFDIWQNQEVSETQTNCDVDDGRTDSFFLIVKDSVSVLNYYEAEFFDACTTTSVYGQNAIRTKKEFIKIFNNNY